MKKLAKLVLCFVLITGLVYTPVAIPQLSNTQAVAVAEAATVKLSQKNVKLYKNGTFKLKVNGTKKVVKWSSSKPGVATVKKGLVKAKKVGTTTITAKVGGKKYTCKVTVSAAPKMNYKTRVVRIGGKTTLKVKNAIRTVKWTSSNPKVATVNKGVVTGKKAGTAVITAKVGNKTTTCKVTVKKRVTVNKSAVTFNKVSGSATVKVTYVGNGTISWKSGNKKVATAKWGKNWNGNTCNLFIYPEGYGTTYISVTNSQNKEVTKIKVTVNYPWKNVKVVYPKTIGEQDDPENRMQITKYQFFNPSGSYYEMKITFKCVQHGEKGRTNWGEYFYCYDKNGNLLDENFLYAGSLGVGRVYNDTALIPVGTAKIVFEEYPAPVEDEYYEEDEDYEEESDESLWSYSDVTKFDEYVDKGAACNSKAMDYLKKGDLYVALAKGQLNLAKSYFTSAKSVVDSNAELKLIDSNGNPAGTLSQRLQGTIDTLGTAASMNDTLDLMGVVADVSGDVVLYSKLVMDMTSAFL